MTYLSSPDVARPPRSCPRGGSVAVFVVTPPRDGVWERGGLTGAAGTAEGVAGDVGAVEAVVRAAAVADGLGFVHDFFFAMVSLQGPLKEFASGVGRLSPPSLEAILLYDSEDQCVVVRRRTGLEHGDQNSSSPSGELTLPMWSSSPSKLR